jgi:hypothetical protein
LRIENSRFHFVPGLNVPEKRELDLRETRETFVRFLKKLEEL